jgi:hypothetical protein
MNDAPPCVLVIQTWRVKIYQNTMVIRSICMPYTADDPLLGARASSVVRVRTSEDCHVSIDLLDDSLAAMIISNPIRGNANLVVVVSGVYFSSEPIYVNRHIQRPVLFYPVVEAQVPP